MTGAIDDWNDELMDEVSVRDPRSLVVFSRDWTVDTILSQIAKGYIDLNPKFQRRNAWTDHKRSKLIESLLLGVPVPEVVLAELPGQKKSYVVIDGKQRLMALAGFIDPSFGSWDTPKLKDLQSRTDLNGKSFLDFSINGVEGEDQRNLLGSDLRCTIISHYQSQVVLYDIFYRLNSGSSPLSSQELRQVLNHGPFANYLLETTNKVLPLHTVMRLDGPDNRLRDAEIFLRFISFVMFGQEYDGNLMPFLDRAMGKINRTWDRYFQEVISIENRFNTGTARLLDVFPQNKVGRKFTSSGWETRFNRVLFEVETFYFGLIPNEKFTKQNCDVFIDRFVKFSAENSRFQESIETSTKTIDRYFWRFSLFQGLVNDVFGSSISIIPVRIPESLL